MTGLFSDRLGFLALTGRVVVLVHPLRLPVVVVCDCCVLNECD